MRNNLDITNQFHDQYIGLARPIRSQVLGCISNAVLQ